jgi:hypothetical protein
MVVLGIDREGIKHVLGFWQGATENHEICTELLADMESRHLTLSKNILWVTDGGKGIIKTLKDRFGKKLIHQRCTIHKDRNIWQRSTGRRPTGDSQLPWNKMIIRMHGRCSFILRNGFVPSMNQQPIPSWRPWMKSSPSTG